MSFAGMGEKVSRWILLPALILMVTATSCLNQTGDLRFNPLPPGEFYTLSGNIELTVPVESGLLGSVHADLIIPSTFEKFKVSAGGISGLASKEGAFTLAKVPFASDVVLEAVSGKIVLLRRVYARDLRLTDVSRLTLSLETTARALIWKLAAGMGKELTEWDILAREYEPAVASVSRAIRLALQLPTESVPSTILDLPMVKDPAALLAGKIEPREKILREAHSVLENLLYRQDLELLKHYISPQFGNDWDSSSSWQDLMAYMKDSFARYQVDTASYTFLDMEFLPGSEARVRIAAEIFATGKASGLPVRTKKYVADVFWRREGTFWKILRNLPYRESHPTTAGADLRWGEIARSHADLQTALFREDLDTLEKLVSPTFGNDWDPLSTFEDLTETARRRFNAMDVKIATYTINTISFRGVDEAEVVCAAGVRVINLVPGIDLDTGPIQARVIWRREQGIWKIRRNLPYRFSHPRNLQ